MEATKNQPREPQRVDRRRLLIGFGRLFAYFILGLFLPAGTWKWPRGWLFLFVFIAAMAVASIYLRLVNPEIIAARVNRHEGTKRWDKILLALFFPAVMAIPVVAALDDARFHWHNVPWWCCSLGYVLLLSGMAALTWAEAVNRFFEPTVRIQSDRGHEVVDKGPYALIRHPGYAAAMPLFLGLPLCLGSFWAMIPALLAIVLLVVRTFLEDRMLRQELPGYQEYAQRVRYRLAPGMW